MQEHPDVKEVTVVGVKDEEWGQRVAAAIVPRRSARTITAEELMGFGRERLAGYKQPRLLRFVDKLPRTASGKVRRNKVRELLS
jgi:O-succinylbenzoic acid--CoA ligase